MKILVKSAWGSDDPTKAAFAFLHANAFAEAGHEVQIFLLGEAVSLMKDAGRFRSGSMISCNGRRAVAQSDIDGKNARFVTPPDLVALVAWADNVLSE